MGNSQVSVYRTIGPTLVIRVAVPFNLILFILAGNDNIHETLDEFEIRLDPNTGFHGNR